MTLILSGTDGLSDVDGSAATPAIRGTDANTGIFFPAADTIAFSEGGVEAARIDSAGNFGLGVTPSAWQSGLSALQLNVSGSLSSGLSGNGTYLAQNWYYNGGDKFVGNGYALLYEQNKAVGVHTWYRSTASNSSGAGQAATMSVQMLLDVNGNLGIGTTSPTGRLTVADGTSSVLTLRATTAVDADGRVIGTINFQEPEGTGDGTLAIEAAISGLRSGTDSFNSGGRLAFYTRPFNGTLTQAMTLDASGNLSLGTTSAISKLTVQGSSDVRSTVNESSASVRVDTLAQSGGQGGVGTQSNHRFFFMTNGTERATFDTSGNLLIGATSGAGSKLYIESATNSQVVMRNTSSAGYTSLRLYNDANAALRALEIDYFGSAYSGGERAELFCTGPYPIAFGTNNTERGRFDGSGNFLVGTTSTYNSAKFAVLGDSEQRGSIKSYQAGRGGLSSGGTVTLWSVGNGAYGAEISMTLYISQRDDNVGQLSNTTFNVTAFGGGAVVVTSLGSATYNGGKPFSLSASSASGGIILTLTNTAGGGASTSITMVANVLVGYGSIIWGF